MTDSISIEVRLFAHYREIIGKKKFQLQIHPGTTIREVLYLIEEQFETGTKFIQEIMNPNIPDRIRDYIKFVINGVIVSQDKILDVKLNKEGDVIAIFPPIGGG